MISIIYLPTLRWKQIAFYTMRLVIDPSQYEKLTDERSKLLQVESSRLKQSEFFPCYRAHLAPAEDFAEGTLAEPAKK